jgi:hypothetical protein
MPKQGERKHEVGIGIAFIHYHRTRRDLQTCFKRLFGYVRGPDDDSNEPDAQDKF